MLIIESWGDMLTQVAAARNKGYMVTNFFPTECRVSEWCESGSFFMHDTDVCKFFLRKQKDFSSLFYMVGDDSCLLAAVEEIMGIVDAKQVVVDIVGPEVVRQKARNAFVAAGFSQISELVRMSRKTPRNNLKIESNVSVADHLDIPVLMQAFANHFNPLIEQLPSKRELEYWIDRKEVLVARDEDGVAHSFIIFDLAPASLYLRYWFVSPDYRNQGLGSRLANCMFAKATFTKRQYLWVITDNDNAIKRYEHYGFSRESIKNDTMLYSKI